MRGWDAGGCEVSAFAADGMMEMLGEGVVDDTDYGFALDGEGEGD